jgi:hypothetical protein
MEAGADGSWTSLYVAATLRCTAGALLSGQSAGMKWALLVLGLAFLSAAITTAGDADGLSRQPRARDERAAQDARSREP